MDAEHTCGTGAEDLDEPDLDEEPQYWEDDEAPDAGEPGGWPASGSPASEGGVPDLIGAVLDAGGDPALMSDADLVQSLAGWHAVAARAAARELRATQELLRRRKPRIWDRRADRTRSSREEADGAPPADAFAGRAMPTVVPSREAAAEIALALTATEYSAQAQAELAADLSGRLPLAFAELDAGRADLYRLKVLAEGTQFLSDEDAGNVDALLARRLGQWTTGELREKVRRAVISIDPAAAERRASQAARKARFAVYGNDDQTATAAVERMPAHLGAAVKARVKAIARAAKAAGMTDPMPLLEAKVATGLLLDTLPDIPPPPGGTPPGPGPAPGPSDDIWPSSWFPPPPSLPTDDAPPTDDFPPSDDVPPSDDAPAGDEAPGADGEDTGPAGFAAAMSWPRLPAQAGGDGPGCHGLPAWLRPKAAGRIRLTVPWRTLTGTSPEPGELSWIGPITPGQARDLATAAAADPSCTWQLIVTDDDGHAIAITTLRTGQTTTARPPGLISEITLTIQQSLAATHGGLDGLSPTFANHGDLAGQPTLADLLAKAIPAANLAAAQATARAAADSAAGGCAHTMQTAGYRVPDRLRRWLTTRDRTCRHPLCRNRAAHCDQDHTLAYHRGGRTCTCNLGGLCRVHHQLKQLPGWKLTQDARGCFTWQTPAGLTYRKEPHRYPV
jgi:hypothetical protein